MSDLIPINFWSCWIYKLCRADINVQKMLSLDYASQREHNKVATAAMIERLQEREGDNGSTVVQSEYATPFIDKYACTRSCNICP